MSDVHPVGTVDEEGFAAAPHEMEALPGSIVWGAIAEGVNGIEGAREAEGVIDE
jgi:hypothetical protein